MMKRNRVILLCLIVALTGLLIPAYAAQVTLTVWAVDDADPSNTNPQAAYVMALVKNFEAKNPDIKIDWTGFGAAGNALNQKLSTAMPSDQGPDIFQSWGGSFMGQFADAGKLLDLTSDISGIKASAAAKEAMSWKGKTYGVAPFFALAGLFVNDGLFKKYGLKVPSNMDELEAAAAKLKANGIQAFAVGAKDKWPPLQLYMYMVNRYGGDIFSDAAARKVRFDSDAFVKAGQKLQEWQKKGYFGDKPLAEGYGDAQLLMQTGKAGMQVSGTWLCGLYADKKQTDQTISFHAFPILKGGKGLVTDIMGMTDVGFVASKTAASKKAAIVKFLTYLMSVEACQAETGRVCSVPGVKAPTLLTNQAATVFGTAKFVQFWWDQNLPSSVSTPINDTIQTFLMPDTDIKASLKKFEDIAEENMGAVKGGGK